MNDPAADYRAAVRAAIACVQDLQRLARIQPARTAPSARARWQRAMDRGSDRKGAALDALRTFGLEPPRASTAAPALLVYLRALPTDRVPA